MTMRWRQSALVRKSAAMALEPCRRFRAWRASDADYRANPPVICNSFPKSGTHLLVQVLAALPGVRPMHAFLASMPSVTFRQRTPALMARKIAHISPGELVPAHLHHHAACAAALASRHAVHYFIYRDLRDVAVSEAHYLTHMNRWHRLHRYYKALPDDAARINWAIAGASSATFPYDYPDIASRFERYRPWLSDVNVCAVRFEDLIGPTRRQAVARIVAHYQRAAGRGEDDVQAITDRAVAAIDPTRSHTFRAGKVGGWRTACTPQHVMLMQQVAGKLLIDLGYEPSPTGQTVNP